MAGPVPRVGAKPRQPFRIGSAVVAPGERVSVDFNVPDLYTHTGVTLPIQVIHGKRSGPVLLLSGALHGDEINCVEIIRRVLKERVLSRLRGTLVAAPVVNIYGFINKTRYLPDRRDLNRSFPGSETGSLAARMAYLFLHEIVARCNYGIDLHTGAIHRDNLPHVRARLDDTETERIARAFALPVILNTGIVEGSLRAAVEDLGITIIVYEAGEALRFNEMAIRAGVRGVLSVMRELDMLPAGKRRKAPPEPLIARSSTWVRAPQSGIHRSMKSLGAQVDRDDLLGIISDPFGEHEVSVQAGAAGIIIGRTTIPLVNEGEALFHIARYKSPDEVAGRLEEINQELSPDGDDRPPPEPPII